MKKILSVLLFFMALTQAYAIPQYYCTAANQADFPQLLNLIGSIHATNFDQLEQIAVFDLGLTQEQKDKLNMIQKVKLCTFKEQNPDLFTYYTLVAGYQVQGWHIWKPIAIKEALDFCPYLLFIGVDSGAIVLKPLDPLFTYIQQKGYFLTTIGDELINGKFPHPLRGEVTDFVKDKFNLEDPSKVAILSKEPVMSNLVGTTRRAYSSFAKEWYSLSKDIRYFADDGSAPDGIGAGRHAQTILSILAYSNGLEVLKQDHKQRQPMLLPIGRELIPFYVTWNAEFVDQRTSIFTTGKERNMRSFIKYK